MRDNLATQLPPPQVAPQVSELLAHQLYQFVRPLLRDLSHQLDVRLVRTFLATLVAIIEWRNRPHGLLLSELGGHLAGPAHAPAGTKRLSRLLHAPAWQASLIACWLWEQAVSETRPPLVAAMQWWSNRTEWAQDRRVVAGLVLARRRKQWGRQVRHIFDRGYVGALWMLQLLECDLRFVMRYKKGNKLLDKWGEERKAWEIARGQRSWGYKLLQDPHSKQRRKVGVVALSVTHLQHARPLWLVVARLGKGHEPWYLLTSDRVESEEAAWEIVLAYAKRWQIETCWRYQKSELAIESIRLWTWECREKLLLMVTLVYAFLLLYTHSSARRLLTWLLRYWCHRTGKRSWSCQAPLYRLRSALSRLWQAHPPTRLLPALNSG